MSAWSNDLVNNPPHYVGNGIECIDAIEASMSKLEFPVSFDMFPEKSSTCQET